MENVALDPNNCVVSLPSLQSENEALKWPAES
jgi:hypothetical protein